VLIKTGLDEIPALTFAGLRYALAALVLLPFVIGRIHRRGRDVLPTGRAWTSIVVLGVVFYAVTQGAQFMALERLPAQTTTLILSFSPVLVALFGAVFLAERLALAQWIGVAGYLAGASLFLGVPHGAAIGIAIASVGLAGNAGASVIGRSVNRRGDSDPLMVTATSMSIGAVILLVAGIATQGMPAVSASAWLIIGWLAVVNTAFAFVLWNVTLRTLPAVESSVINNTMLVQIAVLAWVFLGESLGVRQIVGLAVAAVGVLVVQLGAAMSGVRDERSDERDQGCVRR
jgi:drug/metabolite transporter (DMT)-like permease